MNETDEDINQSSAIITRFHLVQTSSFS